MEQAAERLRAKYQRAWLRAPLDDWPALKWKLEQLDELKMELKKLMSRSIDNARS